MFGSIPTHADLRAWLTAAPVFDVQQWTTEDGLPQNTVRCLSQDAAGYLWAGTLDGVARFDGREWTDLTPLLHQAHPTELRVDDIEADLDGFVWLVCQERLFVFRGGRFQHVSLGDSAADHRITDILRCSRGGLWVGTLEHGVLRLRADRIEGTWSKRDGLRYNRVRKLYEDREGVLWVIQNPDGVWSQGGGAIHRIDSSQSPARVLPSPIPAIEHVRDVRQDADGAMWIGAHRGFYHWSNQRLANAGADLGWFEPNMEWVHFDQYGRAWYALHPGQLFVREGDQLFDIPDQLAIPSRDFRALHEDREGNIWLATGDQGVLRLRPRRIAMLTQKDGLIHNDIQSIAPGSGGRTWFATRHGLSQWTDGSVTNHLVTGEMLNAVGNHFRTVLDDRNGQVWCGIGSSGLFQFNPDDSSFVHVHLNSITNLAVDALYEDRAGALWAGSDRGLFRRPPQQHPNATPVFVPVDLSSAGAPEAAITAILEAVENPVLWVGTRSHGLLRFDGSAWTRIPATIERTNPYAKPLLCESNNTLWTATPEGLARHRPGEIAVIGKAQGLADERIQAMLADGRDSFWLLSYRGVHRVSRAELITVADGRQPTLTCTTYGRSEGFLGFEGSADGSPGASPTPDGLLLFPTTGGVAVVDPLRAALGDHPPVTVLEEILADAIPVGPDADKTQPRVFSNGRGRSIAFHFNAPTLAHSERTGFRYRLIGYDADWRTTRPHQREAHYVGLKPEAYRFEVIGHNHLGRWAVAPASFAFVVQPYFYETRLFTILCILSALGVIGGIHAYRLSTQRRFLQLERRHALELERTRLARDMHDDLGSKLTQITLMSERSKSARDADALQASLADIGTRSREALAGMSELIWTARADNDSLQATVAHLREQAATAAEAAGIQLKYAIPSELPQAALSPEQRRNILLIQREAFTNAIKHAGATQIDIALRLTAGCLEWTLQDNGRGFDPATARANGNGLNNMRTRAAHLGGTIEIAPQPRGGTRIHLTFPLAPPSDTALTLRSPS